MAYGFLGTIYEFAALTEDSNCIGKWLSQKREETGGYRLSSEEQSVWDKDARQIVNFIQRFGDSIHGSSLLMVEYDIPGHLGRCDLVIAGCDADGRKHAVVFELKRWTAFDVDEVPGYFWVGNSLCLHPSKQALQYRDRFRFFHGAAGEYEWHAASLMTAMSSACAYANNLRQHGPSEAPVYFVNQPKLETEDPLHRWFSSRTPSSESQLFASAPCIPSAKLAEKLLLRLPSLTKGVSTALAGRPIDLTQRQEELLAAILSEVKKDGKVLVLVSGPPGCGKTIVGLHVLVHNLIQNIDPGTKTITKRATLALRNNRLCTVVRSAIDDATDLNVGATLVQYVKGGGPKVGILYEVPELTNECSHFPPPYDLIVVDEAHRIPHHSPHDPTRTSQLEAVLTAGRTVVCMLDEAQVLNEDDNGNSRTFRETWKTLFPSCPILELDLTEQHRVPPAYAEWLETLFSGTPALFPDEYELKIASSPAEVIELLKQKISRGLDIDCGLLASYTVCNGRKGNDIRVSEPRIRWLMKKEEYNAWWRDRDFRHKFDRCSSVYGCQGFELDYAGLFWGRDLALRKYGENVRFELSRPHDIKDDISMNHGKRLFSLANEAARTGDSSQVVKLLINRYRILLSRARKGTFIYCEDPKTRELLRQCVQK